MELSRSNIFWKEIFSYISGNVNPKSETLKKLLIFQEVTIQAKKIHPEKISYPSENGNPEKTFDILLKESFLIFRETETSKKFFIFQEKVVFYDSGNETF